MIDYKRIRTDILALALLAGTLFLALCLTSYDPADPPAQMTFPVRETVLNLCGPIGAYVSHFFRTAFGLGAYVIVLALVTADLRLLARKQGGGSITRVAGWMLTVAALCSALHLLRPGLGDGPIVGSGGYVGVWFVALLEPHFSTVGSLLLITAAFVAGLLLADETILIRLMAFAVKTPASLVRRLLIPTQRTTEQETTVAVAENLHDDLSKTLNEGLNEPRNDADDLVDNAADDEELIPSSPRRRSFKVNPPITAKSGRESIRARLDAESLQTAADDYELPSLDLLEEAEEFPYELLAKKAQIAAQTLEKTFAQFGVNVHVSEIDTGPVITQYELELEAGLRLSKVTALADDLAIALRVPAVRIVAPIPGKNTVGVEVPNEKQVMVRLRELIETCPQEIEKKRIPIFLGKDVSGRPMVVDLTCMPHLLIAGRTGTGKSVCLNTLILSILMTRSPEQVKLLLIDPKMVELSPYRRIPHLMHPVITDMKKAEAVLAWAVDKMEERYDLLSRCGVRHLDGYNKLGKETVLERLGIDPESEEADKISEHMPYIVIVADEMADMMMTSGKDVEGHIIRLAQKSRAVGIHLVLATQKPTVDVITGLIKSNLPARISFQVASRVDSRVVLDEMGAERLLGNGDMLYLEPGTSNISRAQGAFVSDEEINGVIDFFADQEPQYNNELAQFSASASKASGNLDAMRKRDALYEQAIDIVIREGRGSVSLLQRALGIGYGRGARLIDYMAEDGIVGEYNGSQAREVLYSPEQWAAIQAGVEEPELQAAVA
jgi:S-DNA-T family DNA segregation ATPase FtsK/SpoIIIE